MKIRNVLGLILATLSVSGVAAANQQGPLSGTYDVTRSAGCEQQFGGSHKLVLEATDAGIVSLVGPYTYQIGTEVSDPSSGVFNEFLTSFDGSFSNGGFQFTAVKSIMDRLNPVPDYAGEVSLTLQGRVLRIENSLSDAGHMTTPSPVSVCLLNKIK